MGFGAAAFGRRFRIYSIATMVVGLVFGAMTGMQAPRLREGLPTPWMGLWERINIAVYMLWIVVLAVTLLRSEQIVVPREGRAELKRPSRGTHTRFSAHPAS
jgi:hypothetical protein